MRLLLLRRARMPVLLSEPDRFDIWLNGSSERNDLLMAA